MSLHINIYIFELQNLRNALDSMYDARVPALWKKVSNFIDSFFRVIFFIMIRCLGSLPLLASGLLSCWRGMLSSTAGVSRVDLKYSG